MESEIVTNPLGLECCWGYSEPSAVAQAIHRYLARPYWRAGVGGWIVIALSEVAAPGLLIQYPWKRMSLWIEPETAAFIRARGHVPDPSGLEHALIDCMIMADFGLTGREAVFIWDRMEISGASLALILDTPREIVESWRSTPDVFLPAAADWRLRAFRKLLKGSDGGAWALLAALQRTDWYAREAREHLKRTASQIAPPASMLPLKSA